MRIAFFCTILRNGLNRNIGCIEILLDTQLRYPLLLLNRNIGCIEITEGNTEVLRKTKLNRNIGCIEIKFICNNRL